jgi:aryl-alcohol dehydrogenase-like predicted oxidoreductase
VLPVLDRLRARAGHGAHLALGGGALGELNDSDVDRLLDAAVDLGFVAVDVAKSYGSAERALGRFLARRPACSLLVVTKGGYGASDGSPDWSGAALRCGESDARAALGRDPDVFLLHSCPASVLDRDDVRAAVQGHSGLKGYSGDNDDLHGALDRAGALGLTVIEQSLSLLDGKARVHTLSRARAQGLVVLAKRALANAPWRNTEDDDARHQRRRLERAQLPDVGLPLDELFLRFALFHQGVDGVLVGSRRVQSLERAAAARAQGPLSFDVLAALAPALSRCDDDSLV